MAAMDVEASPALEAQRKAHPDLSKELDTLQQLTAQKLYHQLTHALIGYLKSAPFTTGQPAAAAELLEFFEAFVLPFEKKFDKVKWVQILAIICKPQTPEKALELVARFEASAAEERDAKFLWLCLRAENLTLAHKEEEAKEILYGLEKDIGDAYEVDAMIQSQFNKTFAQLWKSLGRHQDFYQSSLLYLAFTPMASIPVEDRPKIAFEIGVAALVAEEEFNFGELLQQELVSSLDGSPYAWIKDLLKAFGEGSFELYDAALAKHRAQLDAVPELKAAENDILRPKMAALALMEHTFRQPKKQRRIAFDDIAQHCRVGPKEVERLVMKTMCANLIRGKIDEVAQLLIVSWVKPRILDTTRIDIMRERMDGWSAQAGLLLDHLEEMTPELLVS